MRKSWKRAAFSPDGRWLAGGNYTDDVIEIFDVAARRHVATARNPNRPKGDIGSLVAVGFSANGDRLFVGGDLHFSRYYDEDEDCLAVWSMPDARYLGAIVCGPRENAALLISERGFVTRPRRQGKGKKGRGGSKQIGADWLHFDAAQAGLLGRPVEELLSEVERSRLADIEARWRFAHDLKDSGRLDGQASLPAIVNTMTGLTHVADAVLQHARDAQARTPTFGGGKKAVALSADQLKIAAETLRSRSAEELAVIHEELLAAAMAREEASAAKLKSRGRSPIKLTVSASGDVSSDGGSGPGALPASGAFGPDGTAPQTSGNSLTVAIVVAAAIVGAIVYFIVI